MSSKTIRLYDAHQAAMGRPVPRPLTMRMQAKRLREHAARLLEDAAELEAMADYCGEPELR